MEINRRAFIASPGGVAAVNLMSDEAKADALEDFMTRQSSRRIRRSGSPSGTWMFTWSR
jgi:hypothetical protein